MFSKMTMGFVVTSDCEVVSLYQSSKVIFCRDDLKEPVKAVAAV